MLKKALVLRTAGAKLISTDTAKGAVGAINVKKRDEYYKNLAVQEVEDVKPAGWDQALPYEALPGPKPLPLVGNIWRFLPFIGEFYDVPPQELYRILRDRYGDTLLFNGIPGRKPMVVLYNTKDMEVLHRNTGPFPIRGGIESMVHYRTQTRKDVFQGVGGVVTVQGEEWFKIRTVVNPILMQPKIVMQYVDKMDKVAAQLIENIRYFSTQNEKNQMPEDFMNELYKWTLESIGVIALDKHFGCLSRTPEKGSEVQKLISSVLDMFELLYVLDIRPSLWNKLNNSDWNKFVKAMDFITETTLKYIEEASNKATTENTPDDQLSVFQKLVKIDKKIAVAMAVDMIGAGVDTTAKTMGAALYFLAKNPEAQDSLREELFRNLPERNSPVTQKVLSNSPYLKAAIKETNRLSPIGIGNMRTTIKDMVLGGYQIPKNSDVITLNILTSMDASEFKEPTKFAPERWLRTTEDEFSHKNAHPFASLPFGFGPRSCVGKRLANLELEVGLAKIIRNFKVSWEHEDMVFSARLLYGITSPLKLTVRPVEK